MVGSQAILVSDFFLFFVSPWCLSATIARKPSGTSIEYPCSSEKSLTTDGGNPCESYNSNNLSWVIPPESRALFTARRPLSKVCVNLSISKLTMSSICDSLLFNSGYVSEKLSIWFCTISGKMSGTPMSFDNKTVRLNTILAK